MSSLPCGVPGSPVVAQREGPQLVWGLAGLGARSEPTAWTWAGLVAPGLLTLLTAPWRCGKRTLASLLLARMGSGGELAGRRVARGRAVVVSGAGEAVWGSRAWALGLGDHVGWLCRPFPNRPRPEEWQRLLDRLVRVRTEHDVDLIVIDRLGDFVAGNEHDVTAQAQTLQSLRQLTRAGLGVLVLHTRWPPVRRAGPAVRGHGLPPGHADILIEMQTLPAAPIRDRRRRLRAFARFAETPRQMLIELNEAGTDYSVLDPGTVAAADPRDVLFRVLASASGKVTVDELHCLWPEGPRPTVRTLPRWLDRAIGDGTVCWEGEGHRGAPFRYWLFGKRPE